MGELLFDGLPAYGLPPYQRICAAASDASCQTTQSAGLLAWARYELLRAFPEHGAYLPVNAFYECLPREPDAGNLHVRFDEGEGGCLSGQFPLYSTGEMIL